MSRLNAPGQLFERKRALVNMLSTLIRVAPFWIPARRSDHSPIDLLHEQQYVITAKQQRLEYKDDNPADSNLQLTALLQQILLIAQRHLKADQQDLRTIIQHILKSFISAEETVPPLKSIKEAKKQSSPLARTLGPYEKSVLYCLQLSNAIRQQTIIAMQTVNREKIITPPEAEADQKNHAEELEQLHQIYRLRLNFTFDELEEKELTDFGTSYAPEYTEDYQPLVLIRHLHKETRTPLALQVALLQHRRLHHRQQINRVKKSLGKHFQEAVRLQRNINLHQQWQEKLLHAETQNNEDKQASPLQHIHQLLKLMIAEKSRVESYIKTQQSATTIINDLIKRIDKAPRPMRTNGIFIKESIFPTLKRHQSLLAKKIQSLERKLAGPLRITDWKTWLSLLTIAFQESGYNPMINQLLTKFNAPVDSAIAGLNQETLDKVDEMFERHCPTCTTIITHPATEYTTVSLMTHAALFALSASVGNATVFMQWLGTDCLIQAARGLLSYIDSHLGIGDRVTALLDQVMQLLPNGALKEALRCDKLGMLEKRGIFRWLQRLVTHTLLYGRNLPIPTMIAYAFSSMISPISNYIQKEADLLPSQKIPIAVLFQALHGMAYATTYRNVLGVAAAVFPPTRYHAEPSTAVFKLDNSREENKHRDVLNEYGINYLNPNRKAQCRQTLLQRHPDKNIHTDTDGRPPIGDLAAGCRFFSNQDSAAKKATAEYLLKEQTIWRRDDAKVPNFDKIFEDFDVEEGTEWDFEADETKWNFEA